MNTSSTAKDTYTVVIAKMVFKTLPSPASLEDSLPPISATDLVLQWILVHMHSITTCFDNINQASIAIHNDMNDMYSQVYNLTTQSLSLLKYS